MGIGFGTFSFLTLVMVATTASLATVAAFDDEWLPPLFTAVMTVGVIVFERRERRRTAKRVRDFGPEYATDEADPAYRKACRMGVDLAEMLLTIFDDEKVVREFFVDCVHDAVERRDVRMQAGVKNELEQAIDDFNRADWGASQTNGDGW